MPFEDGYFEASTTVLGGKDVTFSLYIMEKSATEEAADMIARFVDDIPLMYEKGKVAIRANAGSELVSFFVEDQLENLDKDALLNIFPVDAVADITTEMFLAALTLRTAVIFLNVKNEWGCTLDFSLDENVSDELLVVHFDTQFEIIDLSHES